MTYLLGLMAFFAVAFVWRRVGRWERATQRPHAVPRTRASDYPALREHAAAEYDRFAEWRR